MIHLRLGPEDENSYLIEALCGKVHKDKTVLVDELEDVNCIKCRNIILKAISGWNIR
jgi:hypothetical protein